MILDSLRCRVSSTMYPASFYRLAPLWKLVLVVLVWALHLLLEAVVCWMTLLRCCLMLLLSLVVLLVCVFFLSLLLQMVVCDLLDLVHLLICNRMFRRLWDSIHNHRFRLVLVLVEVVPILHWLTILVMIVAAPILHW